MFLAASRVIGVVSVDASASAALLGVVSERYYQSLKVTSIAPTEESNSLGRAAPASPKSS